MGQEEEEVGDGAEFGLGIRIGLIEANQEQR